MGNSGDITGFVLCGGESSRMGSDKGLIRWKGIALAEHAVMKLRQRCTTVVLLSSNPSHRFLDCQVWPDEITRIGPAGGILAALRGTKTDQNYILACDMPLLPVEVFDQLQSAIQESAPFCLPVSGGRIHPLCGIYRKSAYPEISQLVESGNFGITRIVELCHSQLVTIVGKFGQDISSWFLNVNSAGDLEDLIRKENGD